MMNKRFLKGLLVLFFVMTAVFIDSRVVHADTRDVVVHEFGTIRSITPGYIFTVSDAAAKDDVFITVNLSKKADVSVIINKYSNNTEDENYATLSSNSSAWETWYGGDFAGYYSFTTRLPAGQYTIALSSDDMVGFELSVSCEKGGSNDYDYDYDYDYEPNYDNAYISESSVVISKGFTRQLKVYNGSVKKWSTSKKSVATVSSKGKVTAKKNGKATITATLKSGKKLSCKVTVKANKYTTPGMSIYNVSAYTAYVEVTGMEYDSKGNLKIKITILNNTNSKIKKVTGIKVKAYTGSGTTIASTVIAQRAVSVSPYKKSSFSVKIPKSKVKKKKADLRNAYIWIDRGMYWY